MSRATGVPERTISRILARRGLPPLVACAPVTGAVIRATRSTAVRYERQRPGELILAYAEIHPDEKDPIAAEFLLRAAAFFKAKGIGKIERISLWTNGKIERFNGTPATGWAYAKPFTSNTDRAAALDPGLNHYNAERIHAAIKGTPITRVTLT